MSSGEDSNTLKVAFDALETVKRWPEHLPFWWRLVGLAQALSAQSRDPLIRAIEACQWASPQARWFQHSAVYGLTRRVESLAAMARLSPDMPDAESVMALYAVIWSHAILHARSKQDLRRVFIDTAMAQVLQAVGQQLPTTARPMGRPDGSREVKRVAVLVNHLARGGHAPTDLALNLVATLGAAGLATQLFSTQDLSLSNMASFFASGEMTNMDPIDPSTWTIHALTPPSVSVANSDFSITTRWADMLSAIDGFVPDVVLSVGMGSPFVAAVHQRYPVLSMPVHALPPLTSADVWLAADPSPPDEAFWPHVPRPAIAHFPFRFWPAQRHSGLSREAIDVPQAAVLWVSAGFRLNEVVADSWGESMLKALEEHPSAYWLLIGLPGDEIEQIKLRHPRLRVLPRQPRLADLLSLGDIYLNAPRVGGGATVAMAMELGLAVLSMAGSDGGDKVGDLAVADDHSYALRLTQWMADGQVRKQVGQRLQAMFAQSLDLSGQAAQQGLRQACQLAFDCFAQRTATSGSTDTSTS